MHRKQSAQPSPNPSQRVSASYLLDDADIYGETSEQIQLHSTETPHIWRVTSTPFFAPLSYRDLVQIDKANVIREILAISKLPRATLLVHNLDNLKHILPRVIDFQRHPEDPQLVAISFNTHSDMESALSSLPETTVQKVNTFLPIAYA